MSKNILSVCSWLIEGQLNSGIVKELDRISEEQVNADFEIIGGGVRLIVSKGLKVYQVIKEVRSLNKFFFVAREGNSTNSAYLSRVSIEGKMGYEGEIKLLTCPWYTHESSSKVFDTLLYSVRRDLPQLHEIAILPDLIPGTGEHPFLR